MKKASEILEHLFYPSSQTPAQKHRCYRRFLSHLPQTWQKMIAFIYIKNQTLYIAIRHPGFKMELHYNRDLIKTLLTTYADQHPECPLEAVTNVTIFTSKYRLLAPQKEQATIPRYDEHATGRFTIQTDDEELHRRFERIKERIRCLRR